MPPPFPTQSDATAILHWYTLVERVYQQLDAIIAARGARGSNSGWDAVLSAAAEHFDLEQLSLQEGPPPPSAAAQELHVPLSPVPTWRGPDSHGPPVSLAANEPWHLVARLGPQSTRPLHWHTQLSQFAEHLEQCRQLQRRLEAERQLLDRLHRCLDAQPIAAVLCDARGRAVRVNRAASELAARVPELHLGPGAVRFLSRTGNDALDALFAQVQDGPGARRTSRWEATSDDWRFTLLALTRHGDSGGAAAVPALGLVIQEGSLGGGKADAQRLLPPPPAELKKRLQERFGLTDKEIQLAHALGMGLSTSAYAERSGRSAQTLRTQVKSIFGKLDVHDHKSLILRMWQERQADWVECVSLLLGEPPTGSRPPLAPTFRPPLRSASRPSIERGA